MTFWTIHKAQVSFKYQSEAAIKKFTGQNKMKKKTPNYRVTSTLFGQVLQQRFTS